MNIQLSALAVAILTVNLTMSITSASLADGAKPTPSELKASLTGFARERENSRGVTIKLSFLKGGELKYENSRGHNRKGKWWVIGAGTAPTYDKEISPLKGNDPTFCYDFPRAGKGDIRRVCLGTEKVGDKIYVLNARNGKRSYSLMLKN